MGQTRAWLSFSIRLLKARETEQEEKYTALHQAPRSQCFPVPWAVGGGNVTAQAPKENEDTHRAPKTYMHMCIYVFKMTLGKKGKTLKCHTRWLWQGLNFTYKLPGSLSEPVRAFIRTKPAMRTWCLERPPCSMWRDWTECEQGRPQCGLSL